MDHETLATNVIQQCHEFGPKWKKQNMKIKYQKCVLFWFRDFIEHPLCIDCSSQTRTQAWINSSNALFNRRIRASTGCAASPRSRSTRERARRWPGSSRRRRRQPRPRARRRVGTVAAATPRRAGRAAPSLSLSLTSWFPRAAAARASSRPSTPCPRHAAHAVRRPDMLHGPDPRRPRQSAPRHPSMPKRFPEHPAT